MYARAANMFKMAKNWSGKKRAYIISGREMLLSFGEIVVHRVCFQILSVSLWLGWGEGVKVFYQYKFWRLGVSAFVVLLASGAGNAFSQAARLHLQMQSKHDAATNFVDAGNAFKKADPQGKAAK